ncbi:hypothetical protein LNP25_28105 [Klebsiella variicola subsp. variicola]|nr:hypothetical protein [Klebsiella variicola subsp. variicola]
MKYHSALRVNACLLAMLVISGSVSAATQVINALFMTQAAYSENDIPRDDRVTPRKATP